MTSEALEALGSITVVLADANVLHSRVLRDYLVYVADERTIAVRLSPVVRGEVVEHLQANNSTFDAEQADLLMRLLNAAYPQAESNPTVASSRGHPDGLHDAYPAEGVLTWPAWSGVACSGGRYGLVT